MIKKGIIYDLGQEVDSLCNDDSDDSLDDKVDLDLFDNLSDDLNIGENADLGSN